MNDCFMCARLTEAATSAEARALAAEAKATNAEKLRAKDKARAGDAWNRARLELLGALRVLYAPPLLVFPHVPPKPRATLPTDRFALLELE